MYLIYFSKYVNININKYCYHLLLFIYTALELLLWLFAPLIVNPLILLWLFYVPILVLVIVLKLLHIKSKLIFYIDDKLNLTPGVDLLLFILAVGPFIIILLFLFRILLWLLYNNTLLLLDTYNDDDNTLLLHTDTDDNEWLFILLKLLLWI
jgi:hypothetical protein